MYQNLCLGYNFVALALVNGDVGAESTHLYIYEILVFSFLVMLNLLFPG
jgi:hypothetical protein